MTPGREFASWIAPMTAERWHTDYCIKTNQTCKSCFVEETNVNGCWRLKAVHVTGSFIYTKVK